jgi:hypothetical protein
MGAYLDLPAGNAGLKEWYDDQVVEDLSYDDNPALAMVPKKPNATGKYIPVPVMYEVGQGRSSTFANAQQNQTPLLMAEFLITLKPDYSLATIAQQLALASQDDKGGFVDFSTAFVDAAIRASSLSAASSLFRAGTGSLAQISSITSGQITLTNAADVSQFGINMTLQANSFDGGSPRAALGYVIARNVIAGQIVVSATSLGGPVSAPAGWTVGDFILVQGDNNAKYSGFQAWLPSTAPSSTDNFYGVNRSVDSRLYGINYNGAQQPVEEAIIDAAMLVRREGGRPKHFITNYGSDAALIKGLGARREYVDWKGEGEIGFRGVLIQGPAGPIECFADRNCQTGTGYLLQMNTWNLYSLDAVPHIFRYGDKLDMLRLANGDASEVRVGYYANLGCRAPGWSSAVTLGV